MTRFVSALWRLSGRNTAVWAAPLLAALGFYEFWTQRLHGITYWSKASVDLVSAQTLLCVALIGMAAWRGRRERNRAMEDLVSTLEGGNSLHLALVWMSLLIASALSFMLCSTAAYVWVSQSATWGTPDWSLILPTGLAVLAATSIGLAVGLVAPYVVTAPLLAFFWWYADGYLALRTDGLRFVPLRALFENVNSSKFVVPSPSAVPQWQAWMGLALIASGFIGVIAYARHTLRDSMISLLAIVGLIAVPVFQLVNTNESSSPVLRTFNPICIQGNIEICVHPASSVLLPNIQATIDSVFAPLNGIPDLPSLATEWAPGTSELPGVIMFSFGDQRDLHESVAFPTVLAVVTNATPSPTVRITWTQAVAATWLFSLANPELPLSEQFAYATPEFMDSIMKDQPAPIETFFQDVSRLSNLSGSARNTWLRQNWEALRAGTLTASDLP